MEVSKKQIERSEKKHAKTASKPTLVQDKELLEKLEIGVLLQKVKLRDTNYEIKRTYK